MYLSIDTTTQFSGLALYGENFQKELLWKTKFDHSQKLLIYIDKFLKENKVSYKDLKGIVVISGPGSFTGIRIGVCVGNTLAWSLNIPILAIDTLLAQALLLKEKKVVAILKASKNEAYLAKFQNLKKIGSYKIVPKKQILNLTKGFLIVAQFPDLKIKKGLIIDKASKNHRALEAIKFIYQDLKTKRKFTKPVHPFYLKKPNITYPSI